MTHILRPGLNAQDRRAMPWCSTAFVRGSSTKSGGRADPEAKNAPNRAVLVLLAVR